ncbi:Oxysterol-binding protein [Necator americanus]|uniref:Oxysterol-binding protein n=1 Tax=Necator americanus TaxID=51031 RepID=W2SXJ2_NECAM|nr:Oxysterol-binding protein [Necator americanus]ETN73601.1 Oxysterol-binding protein [Necator americanus]
MGRDEKERNHWVRALESVIRDCGGYRKTPKNKESASEALKHKIVEADQHLSDIILQVRGLESLREHASEKERKNVDELITSSNKLMDTVKHAIILLQMARNKIEVPDDVRKEDKENVNHGSDGGGDVPVKATDADNDRYASTSKPTTAASEVAQQSKVPPQYVPPISYSRQSQLHPELMCFDWLRSSYDRLTFQLYKESLKPLAYSDEEEFYDADEELIDLDKTEVTIPDGPMRDMSYEEAESFDFGDAQEDFDAIYDNAEEHDVGNVQQEHGSVLVHLLSQVSIGMDLTKVTLPTFILERRSLLEMYADFFAHPDAFVITVDLESPQERFVSVVKYYLNAFYAARKSGVAKKPYNPILGETFRCRYNVPGLPPSGKKTDSGPFPGSDENQLTFIAEQVSHHPPVSAFYAEHPSKHISFHAHIYTKSSFLGLSIGVANIGCGTVILHDYNEQYTVTFPSGYGRSIMSTPWVELGGKVKITCEKTGYYADIDFLTKPFFGGKPHRIQGNLYREGNKKPFMTVRGEWNSIIMAKPAYGDEYLFIDVRAQPEMKKECVPVMQQSERESRRLWRHVTAALLRNRINIATTAKRMIEQRQRAEAKQRLESGERWKTRFFSLAPDEREAFSLLFLRVHS